MFYVNNEYGLVFFLTYMYLQKQNDSINYVLTDKEVVEALKRNGGETKAPKNSHGCKHCAMSSMRKVSVNDFKYYLQDGKVLYKQKCSGKSCPHGLTSDGNWPIKQVCGERWQAYWCKFACNNKCTTFYCVECGQKNLDKEERMCGKRTRSR